MYPCQYRAQPSARQRTHYTSLSTSLSSTVLLSAFKTWRNFTELPQTEFTHPTKGGPRGGLTPRHSRPSYHLIGSVGSMGSVRSCLNMFDSTYTRLLPLAVDVETIMCCPERMPLTAAAWWRYSERIPERSNTPCTAGCRVPGARVSNRDARAGMRCVCTI